MDSFLHDVRAAWRNVRGRQWRAALAVGLLALAVAVNTVVFSTADSFVFHQLPYPNADRLVQIRNRNPLFGNRGSEFLTAPVLAAWQRQTDVLFSVQGYLTKTLFLPGFPGTTAQRVATADVTPGLIELLGVPPRWGRTLTRADAAQIDPQVVLISEGLADERFGTPAAAIGKTLDTTGARLIVAGVMPRDFHFPASTIRIWRAMDPAGPLARGFAGVTDIARLAPGVPFNVAAAAVSHRGTALSEGAGYRWHVDAALTPFHVVSSGSGEERRLLLVLLGTAICLLLTACANVASLELAHAVRQVRTYAIHVALGATRARVIRTTLLEGLILTGSAVLVAAPLARGGAEAVARYLPTSIGTGPLNAIDLDGRALAFMIAIAGAIWFLSVVPVVFFAARANVLEPLKTEGLAASASTRSLLARRALTVAEIAAAVVLPCGSLLYARTYASLVGLGKGFDSRNLAVATLIMPMQFYPDDAARDALGKTILGRLEASGAILDGAPGSPPPDTGDRFYANPVIDGITTGPRDLSFATQWVAPGYFKTVGIRVLRGRDFVPGDPDTNVIISDHFAERFWPGGSAVGHTFRNEPSSQLNHVIGVVSDVRNESDPPGGISSQLFQDYQPLQVTPAPAAASPSPAAYNGGMYAFLTLTLRVHSEQKARAILPIIQQIEPRTPVSLEFVDDLYAERYADRLLATRVIGAFGTLAFIVAAAGIYGLMAFLVATRRREIGIRMALGADRSSIRRLVVSSALRLVVMGIATGLFAGLAASRLIESQLFGVKPTDPETWLTVMLAVIGVALFATWYPARTAAAVDPSRLLRE